MLLSADENIFLEKPYRSYKILDCLCFYKLQNYKFDKEFYYTCNEIIVSKFRL